jgi:uncharacterized protein
MAEQAFFPGRAPVDAYGNGGFRFAEMRHRGSLLFLPSGIYAWNVRDAVEIDVDDFSAVFSEAGEIGFLLLGTGRNQIFPGSPIRQAFLDYNLGLEVMDTGAACRTYNVLLAEGRDVAAAFIAVD